MPRALLTDDVLADLLPTLTSTTIAAIRPRDLRRSGTVPPEVSLAAGMDGDIPADKSGAHAIVPGYGFPQTATLGTRMTRSERVDAIIFDSDTDTDLTPAATESLPDEGTTAIWRRPRGDGLPHDEELFDEQVLAASADVPTQKLVKRERKITDDDLTPTGVEALRTGIPKRKPTDSFTLNPDMASRVFESETIEVCDPATGDHLAFVRGILHRDDKDRVTKIQVYLQRGRHLGQPGARLEFRAGGEQWRVRDGFYVTPRGGAGGEWMYVGYVSG